MNPSDRKLLQKMIKENDVTDNTHLIRQQNLSDKIKGEVESLIILMKKHANIKGTPEYDATMSKCCPLLSTKYSKIYEKILDKSINLDILSSLISELKQIENGNIDQHEASFQVGKTLKSHFVDKKLGISDGDNSTTLAEKKEISWEEYKNLRKST